MTSHASAEALSAYLDRQLVAREARELEEHLETCPQCHVRLESLRKVIDNLRSIHELPTPSTLQQAVVRRIALTDEPPGLLDRFEQGLSLLNRQNPILAMFGVVIALVLFIYLFSLNVQLHENQSDTIPVIFQDPPNSVADVAVGNRVIVADRLLIWNEQGYWLEQGVDADAVTRRLQIDSEAGRELFAVQSEIAALAALKRAVVIKIEGDVVRLE